MQNFFLVSIIFCCPIHNFAFSESPFVLQPGILFLSQSSLEKESTQTNNDRSSSLNLNLTGGYDVGFGLVLGAKYFSQIRTAKLAKSSSTDKSHLSSVGLTVGTELPNAWIAASWMGIQPPERLISNSDLIYKGGTGLILDVMLFTKVGRINFGPQVSWIMLNYKSKSIGGSRLSTFETRHESYFIPYFAALMAL
jgi:hypothetical protein